MDSIYKDLNKFIEDYNKYMNLIESKFVLELHFDERNEYQRRIHYKSIKNLYIGLLKAKDKKKSIKYRELLINYLKYLSNLDSLTKISRIERSVYNHDKYIEPIGEYLNFKEELGAYIWFFLLVIFGVIFYIWFYYTGNPFAFSLLLLCVLFFTYYFIKTIIRFKNRTIYGFRY